MGGWVEQLGFKLGRALRMLRREPWTSMSTSTLAVPAEWDPAHASANLGVFDLSEAQMAEREITVAPIGELDLPTGEIIACDPLTTGKTWPALSRKVKPGRYPVSLLEAQGRVAAAVLRFRSGTPVRWELATLPDQDTSTLKDDEIFGYPVDTGLGSFMDRTAMMLMSEQLDKLEAKQNYYDDVLAMEFESNQDRLMHHPVAGNPLNIAMFSSGCGDGVYPSFWGLDATGAPLLLMTDFDVLENADGRESE
ncbi:hypothetical protein CK228_19885 [Mesorhizobium sp. WSM4312]|uniref:DUF4241 domain-containing protein n=1 Tax=Mesorhizobium sp. WSM4312 TaxID=2029411 RepID=UPI000BAEED71|nr:DUF4241 domain-containing protein [Mesorhizobium sp. WSM4312]PBB66849.1 hypothetical protein CK228_19885 [Mesorhizobium sp. WSM4312]